MAQTVKAIVGLYACVTAESATKELNVTVAIVGYPTINFVMSYAEYDDMNEQVAATRLLARREHGQDQ